MQPGVAELPANNRTSDGWRGAGDKEQPLEDAKFCIPVAAVWKARAAVPGNRASGVNSSFCGNAIFHFINAN